MSETYLDQLTSQVIYGSVRNAVKSFLLDRRSRGLAAATIRYYTVELGYFCDHLDLAGVVCLGEITPDVLRGYFLELSRRGRNRGGVHGSYRAIKAFLKWVWDEYEIDQRNPIDKVHVPAGSSQPIPGLSMEDFKKMLAACTTERDRAVLLTLVDTGVRRSELTGINLQDIDLNLGVIKVIGGKGGKDRYVFIGQTTKRAIKKYLRSRSNLQPGAPLFATFEESRLTPDGLRQITRRQAQMMASSSTFSSFCRLAGIAAWTGAG
jgi:integrase/recombinase XerD